VLTTWHRGAVRVLVATDCFTGTLSAGEAAAAIADGWRRTAPADDLRPLPLSDGGPGFLDVLHSALGGERLPVVVRGPLGGAVPAEVLLVADGADGPVAYVESAQACGLHLVPEDARDPAATTTHGVGELVAAAAATGARRIVVGLGGSATADGGAGLLAALGAGDDADLGHGLSGIPSAPPLDLAVSVRALGGAEVVVAGDVDAPLIGPEGAVRGFGRQKGAAVGDLPALEERMAAWGAHLAAVAGMPRLATAPGGGAAGGVGAALLALGAGRSPGAQVVADAVGLAAAAADCDVVVSGEGTFDWQSLRGKVVTAVARAGQAAAVPVVVIAGQVQVGRRELAAVGVDAAYAVADGPAEVAAALADPSGTLAARAARVAATWSRPPVR
jgi:glycerate kinase